MAIKNNDSYFLLLFLPNINEQKSMETTSTNKKRLGKAITDIVVFAFVAMAVFVFICLFIPFGLIYDKADGVKMPLLIINEVLMLISTFCSIWILCRYRSFSFGSLGLSMKGRWKDLLWGMLFASALYAVGFGTSLLLGVVEVTEVTFHPTALSVTFFFCLLVAVVEEVTMRGFILGRLLNGGVNRFWALLISSLLFSLLHLFNPNFTFLPFLNIILAGFLLGTSYVYTRNLAFPISLHLFWNWIQGPILGYEVSGNILGESLLLTHLPEASILNGGAFGFEGSIICTVLIMIGTGVLLLFYSNHR